MRYSLLSRFQGALVGSALGEALGSIATSSQSQFPRFQPTAGEVPEQIYSVPLAAELRCSQQAIDHTKALIQAQAGQPAVWRPNPVESGAEAAIAALPVILFCHDNTFHLRQELQQTVAAWGGEELVQAEVLAVGYPIARALRERLDPATLIPKLLTFLQRDRPDGAALHPTLLTQLEQVQTLVQQRASLATAIATLQPAQPQAISAAAIAIALYCVLSTPDDFGLTVARAARSLPMPSWVSAIAGMISGAELGLAGMPLFWQLDPLRAADTRHQAQLAAQLLAVWSGATDPATWQQPVAIAAPGVIRPQTG